MSALFFAALGRGKLLLAACCVRMRSRVGSSRSLSPLTRSPIGRLPSASKPKDFRTVTQAVIQSQRCRQRISCVSGHTLSLSRLCRYCPELLVSHRTSSGPTRQVTRMMPIGVPRVPYRSAKEGSWQWVDIWNCLVSCGVTIPPCTRVDPYRFA